ncbi:MULTISPECIES: hypothetical protein [unclassified Herbaspirillum]|uniref:hypothetical protein n=1 Tax=unclassified Herbaspirillum TaxID=2624150 RepID=UPI0011511BEF|nr:MULTISPECIES: hypothetical protein [unclassified Herbaspirillum]MBB5390982.1 hypothetical protein [Herbaspirillum sp. SJZ102]TQK06502.1 hypothetical protein FB599_2657 [Herbaspirillum sp. SJZ130]TQK12020.1 hypothetical protein FB598_1962 [Herbaspirillum sp. SJZ106]TWC64653.1 hypothetical protein FB597_108145 [Herbaspirillum sp. SJZ099]
MILRAKIFLLWLLALAIPVQGFAAVLQACAPVMLQTAAAGHGAHAAHAMKQGEHAQATAHRHGQHAQAELVVDAVADAVANTAPAHDAPHAQHKNASCSYCAACTTGAVLPLALDAPPAPDLPSREFIALPATGFVGYLPENPDRPPASI